MTVTRKNTSKGAARQRQRTTGETYLKALAVVRGGQPDADQRDSGQRDSDDEMRRVSAPDGDPVMLPWCCGDEPPQCPVGWHLQQWVTMPEILVDHYLDGDWEPADPDDVPTWEEVDGAWEEYYSYVAATGLDPLGEMGVDTTETLVERWAFAVIDTAAGVTLEGAGVDDGSGWVTELPEDVRDYFFLRDDQTMDVPWPTTDDMRQALSASPHSDGLQVADGGQGRLVGTFTRTHKVPLDEALVADERRKLAVGKLNR
jgi:hypothetical protein